MSVNTSPTLRGSMPAAGRRPKRIEARRRCDHPECDTVLSQYNLGDVCRIHTAISFPRVRGRTADE